MYLTIFSEAAGFSPTLQDRTHKQSDKAQFYEEKKSHALEETLHSSSYRPSV